MLQHAFMHMVEQQYGCYTPIIASSRHVKSSFNSMNYTTKWYKLLPDMPAKGSYGHTVWIKPQECPTNVLRLSI